MNAPPAEPIPSRIHAWLSARSVWQRRGLAVLAGLVATLGHAPFQLVLLFVAAIVLLVWLLDGATRWQKFRFITWPALATLYLTSTMLSMVWTLGDFNSVYLLTGGGPGDQTHVLATLGIRYLRIDQLDLAMASIVMAMPLVLPPSVLGFYLLLAMGPSGPVGQFTQALNMAPLPFTFGGLVIASVFYSLPFMVQPLQTAFEAVGDRPMEVAATLRASPLDAFFTVAVPLAAPGFVTASILTFAHTVGEFGVVLMIGGNLPGITRVASVQIYDHVEALEYLQAHRLSAVMLGFSFVVLLALYAWRPQPRKGG